MKKIVKIAAFRGNSENSGGNGGEDGVLNSNHRGTGWGKNGQGPRKMGSSGSRGIPTFNWPEI